MSNKGHATPKKLQASEWTECQVSPASLAAVSIDLPAAAPER